MSEDEEKSVTELIDKMALNAGLEKAERKKLRDQFRENSAAGKDYKAFKDYLVELLIKALKT